jgi:hypothetical protein
MRRRISACFRPVTGRAVLGRKRAVEDEALRLPVRRMREHERIGALQLQAEEMIL